MKMLSVVMPGYNEGEQIHDNLLFTVQVMSEITQERGMDFEIVFVNDGSSDNTNFYAKKAAIQSEKIKIISYKKNQGKGAALKRGTEQAAGDLIAFLDSDLDLPPGQLADFLDRMIQYNADAVIGSKMHPESKTSYPTSRKVISIIYYVVLLILFRLNIKDTQTGIKLFKSEVIKPVMSNITVAGYAYDIEVLATIHKLGYIIMDAPIVLEFHRTESWGRIRFRDIVRTAIDTLAIFVRLTFSFDKGCYQPKRKEDVI